MRPVKLTMKAFGSYANKTTIDFNQLQSNIYLISGDTGSGKTTIFDAICFALFGEASGTYREKEMLHSDYVGKDENAEVVLEFEHQGNIHKVTRKIKYTKKKDKDASGNDVYEFREIESVYEEFGKPVIEGLKKVNDRIAEQLGLTLDQFRKIVMLAQGEFREFLSSKDDDRAAILRRLFDYDIYLDFQRRIVFASSVIEKEKDNKKKEIEAYMNAFIMPSGLTESEMALYGANNDDLVPNLETLITNEKDTLTSIKDEKEKAAAKVNELNNTLNEAEDYNNRIGKLSTAKDKLTSLLSKKQEMDELNKSVELAKKAVRNVLPKETLFNDKTKAFEKLSADADNLKKSLDNRTLELKTKEEAKNKAHEDNDNIIAELSRKINTINSGLDLYREQTDDITTLEGYVKSKENIIDDLKKIKKSIEDNELKIKSNQDIIDSLASVEIDLEKAKAASKAAMDNKKLLCGKDGLINSVSDLKVKIEEVNALKQRLLNDNASLTQCKDDYDELYKSFMSNQADCLAKELKIEIEEKGSGVCPVCGTVHKDISQLKAKTENTPVYTQKQVDDAKKKFEKAEKEYRALESEITGLDSKNTADCQNVTDKAKTLFNYDVTWADLISDNYLENKKVEFQGVLDNSIATENGLNNKLLEKQSLIAANESLTGTLEESRTTEKAKTDEQNDLVVKISALEGKIETRKASLEYESLDKANKALLDATEEKTKLETLITDCEQAYINVKSAYDKDKGSYEAVNNQIPTAKTESETAKNEYEDAIKSFGFLNETEYKNALPLEDGEEWIAKKDRELLEYRQNIHDTEYEITNLSEQCNGHEIVDINQLKEKIDLAKNDKNDAENKYEEYTKVVNNHETTILNVKRVNESIDSLEYASKKLLDLKNISIGEKSEKGKLSFERYIMGKTFKEMLDAANVRLNIMSGGRYEFCHKMSTKRQNANAGLGIEILDHQTGTTRSSQGVCGGESFEMALALALGLSDIVQRHAGGQSIDTMYIDEGFGSLSDKALDQAIKALCELSGDNRQIGIISHVERLKESIPTKILVSCDENGSRLTIQ